MTPLPHKAVVRQSNSRNAEIRVIRPERTSRAFVTIRTASGVTLSDAKTMLGYLQSAEARHASEGRNGAPG